ncbi:unnamed protein product [Trichogramma brassicae]|uniref:Uncharacterized protein n=1 Tax=Trichogramma brassicae TaxID=86971 RepID=A0A6H5J7J7_9HYME|nr:unnamed protein product [Trichogramma brassicae]
MDSAIWQYQSGREREMYTYVYKVHSRESAASARMRVEFFGNNPIMWSCGQSLSRSLIDQICASGSTPVLILPCETSSSNGSSSQQPSQQSSSSGMTNYCCCCCRIRGLSAPTQLINNFCGELVQRIELPISY